MPLFISGRSRIPLALLRTASGGCRIESSRPGLDGRTFVEDAKRRPAGLPDNSRGKRRAPQIPLRAAFAIPHRI
jgi:hypothetical protein